MSTTTAPANPSGTSVPQLAYLEIPDQDPVILNLAAFSLEEKYNGGWQATAALVTRGDSPVSLGTLLGSALSQKIIPGYQAVLHLAMGGDDDNLRGIGLRAWPCMISRVEPMDIEGEHLAGACSVTLVDPVSYLSAQQVWGVYKSSSAGQILGGALSLAAGGDGRPSLTPLVPRLPAVKIVEDMRSALSDIPYAIAVGQPLSEWLGDFLGRVGLRFELLGNVEDGSVTVRLSDRVPPSSGALKVQVLVDGGTETEAQAGPGCALITSIEAQPGLELRGQLLDDPSLGSLRRLGPGGAVGRLFLGPSVSLDEAQDRGQMVLQSAHAEMLRVNLVSGMPAIRPGRLLSLDLQIGGVRNWQVASVKHSFQNGSYTNSASVLRGDSKWCPPPPLPKPPVLVSAVIDGGKTLQTHEPVARTRLSQIPVSFPFAPTPIGDDQDVALFDRNFDGKVTTGDFAKEDKENFEASRPFWDSHAAKYAAGEFNDPYPGKSDSQLTPEELEKRKQLQKNRADAIIYQAYSDAKLQEDRAAQSNGSDDGADNAGSDDWPPRIDLNVIQPMAGGLHGFISAHRHGDICRVAVHTPLWAEIVGFQYRSDRQINAGIVGATTGIVVEHDNSNSWSGMVFRPTEDIGD